METIPEAVARHRVQRPDAPALADDRFRLSWGEAAAWMEATSACCAFTFFCCGRIISTYMSPKMRMSGMKPDMVRSRPLGEIGPWERNRSATMGPVWRDRRTREA